VLFIVIDPLPPPLYNIAVLPWARLPVQIKRFRNENPVRPGHFSFTNDTKASESSVAWTRRTASPMTFA